MQEKGIAVSLAKRLFIELQAVFQKVLQPSGFGLFRGWTCHVISLPVVHGLYHTESMSSTGTVGESQWHIMSAVSWVLLVSVAVNS